MKLLILMLAVWQTHCFCDKKGCHLHKNDEKGYANIVQKLACVKDSAKREQWLHALSTHVSTDQMKQLRRIFDKSQSVLFNPDLEYQQNELWQCPIRIYEDYSIAQRLEDEQLRWHATCMFRYGTRTYNAYLDNRLDYDEQDHQDPEERRRVCGDR